MATFVVACCDGAEVLKSIERALDDIAAFVSMGVEPGRGSTAPPFAQSVGLRIFAFRANALDASLLDGLAIGTCAISSIDSDPRRALSWAPWPSSRNGNGIENWPDLGSIGTLAGSDDQ